MPGKKVKLIAVVLSIALMLSSVAVSNNIYAQARACPDLPVVPWWKTNHNKITEHVEHYYNGKWDIYIDKWVQYRERLIQIHESGGIAIIKTKGVKLKGEFLKEHISKVDKRIRITQCLQESHSGQFVFNDYSKKIGLGINVGTADL